MSKIFLCYLVAIFLGIAGLTMSILARRKSSTGLCRAMMVFAICLMTVNIYDMFIYYNDYIVAQYTDIELLRLGDCFIAVLFLSWLGLEQKLVEEDILEKHYRMAKIYVLAYFVVWMPSTLILDETAFYAIRWLLLISDIVLLLMMLIGSIAYIVAALYKKSDRGLTTYMVVITAAITWNYTSYFWGEASVYWGNSSFVREPLDLTVVFWFAINIAMIYLVYRRAFVPAYMTGEKEALSDNIEDRLVQIREKYDLTERECDLVELIYEGHSNSEIAEKLFISESTVKTHIYKIFKKMGIKSRISIMKIVSGEEIKERG